MQVACRSPLASLLKNIMSCGPKELRRRNLTHLPLYPPWAHRPVITRRDNQVHGTEVSVLHPCPPPLPARRRQRAADKDVWGHSGREGLAWAKAGKLMRDEAEQAQA